MKYLSHLLKIGLLCMMFATFQVNTFAMETGLDTKPYSDSEYNDLKETFNIYLLSEEPEKKQIECFDVNEKKLIALGYNSSNYHYISIYNDNGIFQYGYKFSSYGSFRLEWDNDNILIYSIRENAIISINPKGEITEIRNVLNTTENNTYMNETLSAKKRKVDDTEYIIQNGNSIFNSIAARHSQLVVVENGRQRIIYDVKKSSIIKGVLTVILYLGFFAIIIYVIIITTLNGLRSGQYKVPLNNRYDLKKLRKNSKK